MDKDDWINYLMQLQAIAQNGLAYSKNKFDIERYEQLRNIVKTMIANVTQLPLNKVNNLFCNETGYQTPKIGTRASIISNNKILLVQEENHKWSLPGGWCEVNLSIKENIIKEVKEETGLNVKPRKIIALEDRNKHNSPKYLYGICKIFIACDIIDGKFQKNNETLQTKYFKLDDLPKNLSNEKSNLEQIKMCYQAYQDPNWEVFFD